MDVSASHVNTECKKQAHHLYQLGLELPNLRFLLAAHSIERSARLKKVGLLRKKQNFEGKGKKNALIEQKSENISKKMASDSVHMII